MKQLVILALFSVAFSQPGEGVSGYLRQTDMSFCMDGCGQYYIDNIVDFDPIAVIFPDTFDDIDLHVNRYVEAGIGQENRCLDSKIKSQTKFPLMIVLFVGHSP